MCKLDLDLDLPARYFEILIQRTDFPAPGNDGPVQLPLSDTSRFISERIGDENSAGMTKFFRTTCFRQIGGFTRELMWDGIDGHRCRQLGWIAIA